MLPARGSEVSFAPAGSCYPSDQLPGRLHTAFSTTKCSVCYFFFPPSWIFFEDFNPFIWKLMLEG